MNRQASVIAFISYAFSFSPELIKGTQFLKMFVHLMYADAIGMVSVSLAGKTHSSGTATLVLPPLTSETMVNNQEAHRQKDIRSETLNRVKQWCTEVAMLDVFL